MGFGWRERKAEREREKHAMCFCDDWGSVGSNNNEGFVCASRIGCAYIGRRKFEEKNSWCVNDVPTTRMKRRSFIEGSNFGGIVTTVIICGIKYKLVHEIVLLRHQVSTREGFELANVVLAQ